jgi:hypothetical protein
VVLKCEPDLLKKYVAAYPELQAYLQQEKILPEPEMRVGKLHDGPGKHAAAKVYANLADQLHAEEEKMKHGLASLGITESEIPKLVGARNFGKLHFDSIRQIVSGGLLKTWVNLHTAVDKVDDRLEQARGMDVDSERLLRDDRSRLIGHIINLSDRVMQGALIETKINKSKTNGNARPNRPGYNPQVTINNPSSVSVNEPKSK